MNEDMRPIDGNGHVPDEGTANPPANPDEVCGCCLAEQIITDHPEAVDMVTSALLTVIEQLETMRTTAVDMLAKLRELTNAEDVAA